MLIAMALSHRPDNFNRSDRIAGRSSDNIDRRSNRREESIDRDQGVKPRGYKRHHFIDRFQRVRKGPQHRGNHSRRPTNFSDNVQRNGSEQRRRTFWGGRSDSIEQEDGHSDRPTFLINPQKKDRRRNESYELHRDHPDCRRCGWKAVRGFRKS